MNPDLMSIRAMCDAFNISARTLRFYEAKELLSPIREGQKRLFTPRDRARLKLILRGKRFGFGLEEMRQLLNLYDAEGGEQVQLREAQKIAAIRLQEMIQQREELQATISELRVEMAHGKAMLASIKPRFHIVGSDRCGSGTAKSVCIQPSDRTASRKFARM